MGAVGGENGADTLPIISLHERSLYQIFNLEEKFLPAVKVPKA